MANKRQLKKFIKNSCGSIAAGTVLAAVVFPDVDRNAVNEIVNDAVELQTKSLSRINVSFDKREADFENRGAYNKARHEYYAAALRSLLKDFDAKVLELVAKMNAAMPQAVRDEFKKAAAAE